MRACPAAEVSELGSGCAGQGAEVRAPRSVRTGQRAEVRGTGQCAQLGAGHAGQGAEVRAWRSGCAGPGTEVSVLGSGRTGQGAEVSTPQSWQKLVPMSPHSTAHLQTRLWAQAPGALGAAPLVPHCAQPGGSCIAVPPKHQPFQEPLEGRAVSLVRLWTGGGVGGAGACCRLGTPCGPPTKVNRRLSPAPPSEGSRLAGRGRKGAAESTAPGRF